MPEDIYQFTCLDIAGNDVSLIDYAGQVLLVVNTASQCGFTPQYDELEALYLQYSKRGFSVLGFPCNQFGLQEPGSNAEIQNFCTHVHRISFPMFSKIEVKGQHQHPLYQWLTSQKPGIAGTLNIKWNFTKFLVDGQGQVVARFAPITRPEKIAGRIEKILSGLV